MGSRGLKQRHVHYPMASVAWPDQGIDLVGRMVTPRSTAEIFLVLAITGVVRVDGVVPGGGVRDLL